MMSPSDFAAGATPLTDDDRRSASVALKVNLAAVRAVETVESCHRGFDADTKRPIILFEPHVFSRLTRGRFDESHPEVSYAERWSKPYPQGQKARYDQLLTAMALDETAALQSASWGLYQIMGGNYRAAGGWKSDADPGVFASVQDFVRAMVKSEAEQLMAFVRFVAASPEMHKALQLKNWSGFARRYNGPAYAQHAYDQKLKAAYAAASRPLAA